MKLKNHLLFPVLCYKDHLHTKQINLFKKKFMHCREKEILCDTKPKELDYKIYYSNKKKVMVNALI